MSIPKNCSVAIITALFLTILTGCQTSPHSKTQTTPAPEELLLRNLDFEKRIQKVGNNLYVAIGYGLANSILIEGKDSVIIVDCMESMKSGQEVKEAFTKICPKPVKAIIYTHFHTDHTSGAVAMAGNDKPNVYAQELLPHYLNQTAAVVRHITEKRAYRMFGVFLDSSALVNCGIGPKLVIDKDAEIGVLKPTVTFADSLAVTIAGIEMVLYHAPGETPDQLFVWLPQTKTLLCGDNLYKTFPNLYTIRGTAYRDINLWKNSLDKMRYLHPHTLVPSHTEPVLGAENVFKILTDYRDAIQFVHDQTVRGMNKGMTPDELAETVILPQHLQQSEWLKEFYGKTEWSVRTVFDGYLGFFDGNPATLLPLPVKERAQKIEQLAGGKQQLETQMNKAAAEKAYQWLLELTDYYLALYPGNPRAVAHRIQALTELGAAQTNPNARHYYLTSALELQGLENNGLIKPTPQLVRDIPMQYIFNGMAAHLNPDKSSNVQQTALFHFTDTGAKWTVQVRRGVAEVQPFAAGAPDITISVTETVWKELTAKVRNPITTYLSGEIQVTGGQLAFLQFMRLFDMADE
ncbi:MBL fold metallo-hydrolase [Sphingobacteriales bacterium UPWRP_1]|nr:hypothetical protein BVG80_07790 [Sphingobacteriales bacterium TSM_CSM]PSJ73700.1 MBL fold metallo-hydrolase [Sphingobacteriales bacterium UPWRP_1]